MVVGDKQVAGLLGGEARERKGLPPLLLWQLHTSRPPSPEGADLTAELKQGMRARLTVESLGNNG